jgi:aminoglycoside 3-N-acetyltransferase
VSSSSASSVLNQAVVMHANSWPAAFEGKPAFGGPAAATDSAAAVALTRRSLAVTFSGLGLGAGDVVLVHASLSSLGFVVGGAVAVVQALLDTVGTAGTVVVPTFTAGNCDPSRWTLTRGRGVRPDWWPAVREHLPPFDPRVTPSENMGAVAETVRTWPGSVRSSHPQTSFAAVGPVATSLMSGHPPECHLGPGTPLARLTAQRAKVLLLGVPYAVCSAFHLAEYQQPAPPTRDYECVILDCGRRSWFRYRDVLLDDGDFQRLGQDMESSAAGAEVRRAPAGPATLRSVPIDVCVGFARTWIAANRGPALADPGRGEPPGAAVP